ncbi:hypothetical protein CH333_09670 [candidate division WOR-3 bacterium JGI_Cruoil_03_44_89]|uniref:Radical SAM core domain-containing protein n=1 Tax=candidate division WOR-3 bacterium JGI_Cruoil_03_44_89 TaxID=1973748 RepID=A0A235BNQ6_UNCW3|nr:MAG: hypothetical protein CH333_09670 [candidate division WOR-3 bacterium JGI_Cruoil_03_44_89]
MGLWVVSKKKFDVVRLKFLLENAASKKIISGALIIGENGKTRLENALDSYGEKSEISFVQRVKILPILKVLDIVRRGFNRTPEEFKKSLKDPTLRKVFLNSFRSLQKYGLTLPQNFYMPMMVVWNFTYKCNLRCKHCYEDAGMLMKGSPNELTTEEKFKVVDDLASNDIPTIFFSGGEPIIKRDFWDVAKYAKEKGMYLSIASNGTLFTKGMAKKAKDIGFGYIAISLDASTPKKHDEFRGVPGMWKRSVEGIRNCLDAGITTCIQYTFTRNNADELPKMLKLREKLGAYKLIVYNYVPVGRGSFEMDPTPEQREEAYKVMYDELEAGHQVVASTAPQMGRYCKEYNADTVILSHYGSAKNKELGAIAEIIGGCGAGRAYCAIQPDGKITPCVYMPKLVVGDLRKQSFKEIWEESPVMISLRDRSDLQGHCATCEYKALCGGCRARAYAYFGDLKGADPGCIFNREYYYEFLRANHRKHKTLEREIVKQQVV